MRNNIKKRKYNKEEVDYIKKNYDILPAKQIAEKLNRSIGSIRSKAYFLGLTGFKYRRFSEKEKAFLIKFRFLFTVEEFARRYKVTNYQISEFFRTRKLEYKRNNY